METRQDNDMIDYTDAIYAQNEIELLGPIWSGAVYDENQIRLRCDQSYRCGLHLKWNWVVMTDWTEFHLWWKLDKTTIWAIVQV